MRTIFFPLESFVLSNLDNNFKAKPSHKLLKYADLDITNNGTRLARSVALFEMRNQCRVLSISVLVNRGFLKIFALTNQISYLMDLINLLLYVDSQVLLM